ncbi:2-C-methyl-D-erythritol 4-phosphate cytidylyltransferase [Thalassotalea profundi]|uniref:2-C-methyl-D-erythritol 4-phosphate cytidylyltransferase n=1 Tax=Thalassotalea profundi TaxID=2036687 RepID=A0ABQ3IMR8_9GAMM|nr:2-C-methyl-D-erythritol 4-phosphate cytidylyltransferase [Thalassotalea profundi]GHE87322.1 2-C-methyl-D-erythritol 4-phosphate cytidylyltransferase [Thalassotalea profundi]
MTKQTEQVTNYDTSHLVVIVPAAGIGKRMKMQQPKQYLMIKNQTILEHTVHRLLSHPNIVKVIIVISPDDDFFATTDLAKLDNVNTVVGGKERVDSVLAGLKSINKEEYPWVLVHDAARPCVSHHDISALIEQCQIANTGGLLATPIRDTIKRSTRLSDQNLVLETVDRDQLWHALTPQMYPTEKLLFAIETALTKNAIITDEASAIEHIGVESLLVEGSSDNLKITRPDDLQLAEYILSKQQQQKFKEIV